MQVSGQTGSTTATRASVRQLLSPDPGNAGTSTAQINALAPPIPSGDGQALFAALVSRSDTTAPPDKAAFATGTATMLDAVTSLLDANGDGIISAQELAAAQQGKFPGGSGQTDAQATLSSHDATDPASLMESLVRASQHLSQVSGSPAAARQLYTQMAQGIQVYPVA